MSEYPRDEFDELGAVGHTGAHRAVRPRWRTYLPFLIILIVAPLLAWSVVWAMHGDSDTPKSEAKSTTTQSATATPSQSASETSKETNSAQSDKSDKDVSAKPSSEPKPSESDSDRSKLDDSAKSGLQIRVSNVNASNGAAGRAIKKLADAGYTKGEAVNSPAAQLVRTTVFYGKDNNRAAAEEIAKILGITVIEQSAQIVGSDDIRVYMKNDYREN